MRYVLMLVLALCKAVEAYACPSDFSNRDSFTRLFSGLFSNEGRFSDERCDQVLAVNGPSRIYSLLDVAYASDISMTDLEFRNDAMAILRQGNKNEVEMLNLDTQTHQTQKKKSSLPTVRGYVSRSKEGN